MRRRVACSSQRVDAEAAEAAEPKPISKRKQRVLRAIARAADPVAAAAAEAEEAKAADDEAALVPVAAPSFPALSAKEMAVRRR